MRSGRQAAPGGGSSWQAAMPLGEELPPVPASSGLSRPARLPRRPFRTAAAAAASAAPAGEEVRSLMWQLIVTIKYLHSIHVWHRDMKSQNVFLVWEGGERVIKVGVRPGRAFPHRRRPRGSPGTIALCERGRQRAGRRGSGIAACAPALLLLLVFTAYPQRNVRHRTPVCPHLPRPPPRSPADWRLWQRPVGHA